MRYHARRLRGRVEARDGEGCAAPGCPAWGRDVDHVVPLIAGGGNELSNLRLLCAFHHAQKTSAEARNRRRLRGALWPSYAVQ